MKLKETFKSRKNMVIAAASVLAFAFILFGISYAFFSYSRNGLTENTISSGAVKFIYTEKEPALSVNEMMPMTDAQGKAQANYFDFSIKSTTGNEFQIPYTITARVKPNADPTKELDPKLVKVWLSDADNGTEYTQASYFGGLLNGADDTTNNPNPSLARFTAVSYANNYNERILYNGTIPADSNGITKNFRLRMWVAENANFSPTETVTPAHCSDNSNKDYATCIASSVNTWDGTVCSDNTLATETDCLAVKNTWVEQQITQTYPLNDKSFTIIVNVYANGEMIGNVSYNAADIAYTNAAAPGVTNVQQALNDLSTRLGN